MTGTPKVQLFGHINRLDGQWERHGAQLKPHAGADITAETCVILTHKQNIHNSLPNVMHLWHEQTIIVQEYEAGTGVQHAKSEREGELLCKIECNVNAAICTRR